MPLLIIFVILFPYLYLPWINNYYFLRFLFLLLISLAIIIELIVKRRVIKWEKLNHLPGKWWLLGFYCFLILAAIFSPYKEIAIFGSPFIEMGALTYISISFLFLYTYLVITPERLKRLLTLMFYSAVPVAVYGLIQFYAYPFFYQYHKIFYFGHRSSGTIGFPNVFGTYLLIMFLTSSFIYIQSRKKLHLLLVCVIYACFLTAYTRSVWIAGFVSFIILAIYYWKNHGFKRLVLALFVTSVLVLGTSPTLISRLNSATTEVNLLEQQDGSFGSGRGFIWSEGWKSLTHSTIKEFLLGSGPDTYYKRVVMDPKEKQKRFGNPKIIVPYAYNIYLEIALTMGLPALVCLFLFYIQVMSWRRKESFSFILTIGLVGYLIQGLFNVDVISVYPFIMLGLAGLADLKGRETGALDSVIQISA